MGVDPVLVSAIVLDGLASHALKSSPSNFVATKDGTIKFMRSQRVSDSRTLNSVRPLQTLSEAAEPTMASW